MQLTQEMAQKKLADMNIDDMPIISIMPTPVVVPSDWFLRYKKLCHEFLISLTDSIEELSFMNLSQNEFMGMLTNGQLPQNTSIRFRIPLIWGGTLKISNMFMCRTFPISHNLDRFIIEQTGNAPIWLPNPAKKIYISAHTASGGDGGNATEDRLAQITAYMSAGRGGQG